MHELDMGVIKSLPPEVFAEINDVYYGESINVISKKKQKKVFSSTALMIPQNIEDVLDEERSAFDPPDKILHDEAEAANNDIIVENSFKSPAKEDEPVGFLALSLYACLKLALISTYELEKKYVNEKIRVVSVSTIETSCLASVLPPGADNIMPSSLSQVDPLVLEQLPEEFQVDIRESLPAHRRPHVLSNDVSMKYAADQAASTEFMQSNELLVGNPPKWVDNFLGSSCCLLNIFSELHKSSGPGSQLSSVFQQIISAFPLPLDNRQDDAVSFFCELIKQYVKLKIETDIEEIYTCSCILRRLLSVKPMEEALRFVMWSGSNSLPLRIHLCKASDATPKITLLFIACCLLNIELHGDSFGSESPIFADEI